MRKGKVKFYSKEKGYGFIFDLTDQEDVFFHITDVVGPEPPIAGDSVLYEIESSKAKGKRKAQSIKLVAREDFGGSPAHLHRKLNGFPCIRGQSIFGFHIQSSLGEISVGRPIIRWLPAFKSVNCAREALIAKAQSRGANAILNFTWHNDKRREKRVFGNGYYYDDNFWAEGEAVFLISD